MTSLLGKAEKEAGGDERALNWIRLARIGFDQIRLTASVYRAHREYEAKKSREALQRIANAIQERAAFVEKIESLPKDDPAFTRTCFANHRMFVRLLDNECRSAPMGVPFTWKIDELLEQGKLP